MKGLSSTVLSALSVVAVSGNSNVANPMGKVLELMSNLQQKIIKEGEAEMKAFHEYSEWCEDVARNAQNSIKTLTATKEELEASIAQLTGDISADDATIEKLSGNIHNLEHDSTRAAKIRETESADFKAAEADAEETIDMLARASSILTKEMQTGSFAQLAGSSSLGPVQALQQVINVLGLSTRDSSRLQALLQSHDSDENFGAPAAAVYESKSGGLIDILENMQEKAESSLSDLRKTETESQHEYQMLAMSLKDELKADNKHLESTKSHKSSAQESVATAEGDLKRTTEDLKNTQEDLETDRHSCMTTARDHESAVHARAEELNVIAKAKQIIKDTTSGAEGRSYSFVQVASRMHTHDDFVRTEVVTMLRRLANAANSPAMMQLASKIGSVSRFGASGQDDQFAKIKGLIRDMISKLEGEAEDDATEKAYCDKELAHTQEKRADLEEDHAKMTAKIDKATARSAKLKEQIKELNSELAALLKSQADMDKLRAETRENFKVAQKDLKLGLSGVRQALKVLRDYYSADAAALLQQKESKATGAAQGIIGMLEVVESDFANGLASEEAAEEDAQNEYEKTTKENEISRTSKEQDVKYKTQETRTLEKDISEVSSDLETTNKELSAVVEYHNKLKGRCVAKPETYEERKKRRETELEGLKQALSVLEDETAFVQRKSRRGNMRGVLMP